MRSLGANVHDQRGGEAVQVPSAGPRQCTTVLRNRAAGILLTYPLAELKVLGSVRVSKRFGFSRCLVFSPCLASCTSSSAYCFKGRFVCHTAHLVCQGRFVGHTETACN